MGYCVHPINTKEIEDIASWEYDPPYSIYNLAKSDIPKLIEVREHYFGVYDEHDRMIGYCCYGESARVPGGHYSQDQVEVVDVGIGLHPSLVGRGMGQGFVEAVLLYACEIFSPKTFRVTIANFNKRSQRTFKGLGFAEIQEFERKNDAMKFTQFERSARCTE